MKKQIEKKHTLLAHRTKIIQNHNEWICVDENDYDDYYYCFAILG